jgi:hypothetical protein
MFLRMERESLSRRQQCALKMTLFLSDRIVQTYLFIFNYALQSFKSYCAIWVRRSNFRHQASPRMSPRESTQRRKVDLWARNVREFCLNADLHVTFTLTLP